MFTTADKIGWVIAVIVVVVMGALVVHGPFHVVNKVAAVAAGPKVNQAGQTDFKTRGCVGCHTLSSVGATGAVGPSLNHIGTRHDVNWLVVQLTTPCIPSHKIKGYPCQTMVGVASSLTPQQRKDLAEFLAAEK